MSIQSEITRINGNVANAYTAVSGKGGTLPAARNSSNLSAAIQSIPTGGSTPYAIISVTYFAGNNYTCTCTKGSTVLTAEGTSGKFNFGVPEAGEWTITSTEISSGISSSKKVSVLSQNEIVSVSLAYNPFTIGTLQNTSWGNIASVAASGMASNFWSIGDKKSIVLNGAIGSGLTLSNFTTYVYIIGFNHNGATNTIDFGTFKTSGGANICLCDSKHDLKVTSGSYFNMNNTAINTGGWKDCRMRYYILGSTNIVNGNATATCATSPVSNTLMAALPSDLRAVMKPMTIYTDNVGGDISDIFYITATVDYLPLLSEYEIFGETYASDMWEYNFQSQYSFYYRGNSRVKYKHNATSTASYWWERSPYKGDSAGFSCIDASGGYSASNCQYSDGIAPIFRL